MLYPTINQPLIFLALFVGGIVGGLIFDVFKILTTLSGNDKFSQHFFDFIATILAFCLLFLINLWLNFGQFRLYVPAVYLASFALERFISKFLWTKLVEKWYTSIAKRGRKHGKGKKKTLD